MIFFPSVPLKVAKFALNPIIILAQHVKLQQITSSLQILPVLAKSKGRGKRTNTLTPLF